MSEAMLEYRGSRVDSIRCIRKAARFNIGYPDWRIFLCRILLLSAFKESEDADTDGLIDGLEHCDIHEILAESLQV